MNQIPHENKRVISFHVWNSFFRNLTFNFSYIYVNSVLIAREGAHSFSKLFLFASILSVVGYSSFIFLKPRKVTSVYLAMLLLIWLVAITFYLGGETNHTLLYVLGVGIFLSDLMSPNIAAANIQATTQQFFFRDIFSKTISADLRARILGSVLILILNHFRQEELVFPIFLSLLFLTILSTVQVYGLLPKMRELIPPKVVLQNTKEAVLGLIKNRFLAITLVVVIWSTMCKFLIELILYQRLDEVYLEAEKISSFMSVMNLGVIFLSLMFQRFIAIKILNSWSLSTLLTVLPSVVFLGTVFCLAPTGVVGVVLLSSFFLIVNKSVQIPTSRHCMLVVPDRLKHYSIYSQSVFITLAGIGISSFCQIIKSQWSFSEYVFLVIAITTPIFFVISSMDQRYVMNVWDQLKQRGAQLFNLEFNAELNVPSHAENEKQEKLKNKLLESDYKTNLKYFVYDLLSKSDTEVVEALKVYYDSYEREKISEVVRWHQSLFKSKKTSDIKKALAMCEILGLRCFDDFLTDFHSKINDSDLKREVSIILKSNLELSRYHFAHISLEAQFKFRYLFAKHLHRLDSNMTLGLRHLIKNPSSNLITVFINILYDSKFHVLRHRVEACLHNSYSRMTLIPLIELFLSASKEPSKLAFDVLELIPGHNFKRDIHIVLEQMFVRGQGLLTLEQKLKILFLEEWCLTPFESPLRRSVFAYEKLNEAERLLFKELHIEFVKKSRFFKQLKPLILDMPQS
jgi:hypothetical protein